jgi:predicted RNA-binding protein associated with RNAse of E/G family
LRHIGQIICFSPGSRELRVNDDGKELLLAGNGYKWLMYLPMDEPWCITAFYNPGNELLEWYFDISKGNFLDENGTPCIDDIFLDLVIMPNGNAITIDADELQDALDRCEISREDFDHAYQVRDSILLSKWNDALI